MLRELYTFAADERRATLAGINLFFSALLGANLGALSDIPLTDYVKLIVLLVGAVTAILTIAVTTRRVQLISTSVSLAIVLACVALVPGFGVRGLEDDVDRMIVTLGVWLAMLLLVRFTPSIEGAPSVTTSPAEANDDEIVVPVSRSTRPGGGGKS